MAGYGDNSEFTAWLAENGLSLPVGAPDIAVLRHVGSEYVDMAYEHALSCSSRSGGFEQERAWPRSGHVVGGSQPVPDDLIPKAWVKASFRAAYLEATNAGWASSGRDPSRITKREKAEGVEREFFAAGEGAAILRAASGFNADPLIDGALSSWLCPEASEDSSQGLWAIG